MLTMRRTYVSALLVLGLCAWHASAARADEIDQRAVNRAHDFLKTAVRGRDILGYVHFGSRYNGHFYREKRFVTRDGKRVAGHFALIYRYKWQDDGLTDVAFLCDARGRVYEVQSIWTNAVLNQPWLSANLTIKVIGAALAEAFKDKMTEQERKDVEKLVEDANAKGMLEWSLKFRQALGG